MTAALNRALTDLRKRLERAERQLDQVARRREPREVRSPVVFSAYTYWDSDGDYPTYYPALSDKLPIVFRDLSVTQWTARSEFARAEALSPFGWLPPLCNVDVVRQPSNEWRIIRGPVMLHGKPTGGLLGGLTTAEWENDERYGYYGYGGEDCDQYAFGYGDVHVWYQYTIRFGNEESVYHPQYYADGTTPVTMRWRNVSSAISSNKILTAVQNAYMDWVVVVEPCGLTC